MNKLSFPKPPFSPLTHLSAVSFLLSFSLFQQMWKCKYIETSAKEGTNVVELFEELLKLDTSRQLSLQPIEKTEAKNGMQKMKEKCSLM